MKLLAFTLFVTLTLASGSAPAIEPRDVAEVFSPLIGSWRTSETRTSAEGQRFHYVYRLQWFDEGKTIVRMTISRELGDGEADPDWVGFKGFDPASPGIFYYGFSPSGRFSRGEVRLADDGSMVTAYTGYGPDGAPVEIEDSSSPVDNEQFSMVTLLRRKSEEPWREIGRYTWVRVTDG